MIKEYHYKEVSINRKQAHAEHAYVFLYYYTAGRKRKWIIMLILPIKNAQHAMHGMWTLEEGHGNLANYSYPAVSLVALEISHEMLGWLLSF